MDFIICFLVDLFALGIFRYYLNSFMKMKQVPKSLFAVYMIGMAAVWSVVDGIKNPFFNLLALVSILSLTTLFFEASTWVRAANIIIFVGTGIVIEPVGLLMLHAMNYSAGTDSIYKYYFVVAVCEFIRGNAIYLLCRLLSKRNVRLAGLPKEIAGVLVLVFAFSVINCCFIIILSLESGSVKSLVMCISIIVSIVLTYYFMLYMLERFNYLVRRQYEDEMYREEMYYKEIYYLEMEKRNEYVQNLKHDLKNKLFGLYYLAEKGDMDVLAEQIGVFCKELEKIDESSYSNNPIVDSVLRIKLGVAKSEGIKVETAIRIPKQMQLEHGDIGVLYGNLLDNAIEACCNVPKDKRYIRLENKFISGKMLLIIENSKSGIRNENLTTTKKDSYSHGRGIKSVRRVVEKYNGTVNFTDKEDVFEVSAMLYGIEVKK